MEPPDLMNGKADFCVRVPLRGAKPSCYNPETIVYRVE
jgi:hypothetical protein